MDLTTGTRLGPYEITGVLGRGGMGVVYAAADPRLGRRVAIKLLPAEAVADPERRRRFMQEARAASALNHPNIVTVYEVAEAGGTTFIAMEFIDGTPLDRAIASGPLPPATALEYAAQIASALEAAHSAGIIHRDVKPANMVVTRDGRVKVLDFGIAKLAGTADTGVATVTSAATRLGVIMGTAAYMSPEQAEGKPIDARSDLFSLGAVLYEMLSGRRPFGGDSELSVISSILRATPEPVRGVPREVEAIVQRALQKSPDARYPSAAAMRADLSHALARLIAPAGATWRQPSVVALIGLALVAVLGYGGWQTVQARGIRWARMEAIPQLERAQFTHHTIDAVRLARKAEKYVPEEVARVRQTWMRFRIETRPAGARIEIKNYSDVSADGTWEDFGPSPADMLVPMGYYRVRLTKPGFVPLEVGAMSRASEFTLAPEDGRHDGMVPVPGGSVSHGVADAVRLTPFWIGRLEVTNREFKRFVDAGGYRDQKYWTEPFRRGDRILPFAEAMTRFRDSTNRPGPATWELSAFPEGQADYPVGGLSWFEAAAYARFAGRRLPSIYHWFQASGADEIYSDILTLSNFDNKGPARAGERPGVGPYGTLDMAGNVKEWCTNEAPPSSRRYILGGGWNEPSYRFTEAEARDPWDREPTFGVRLVEDPSAVTAAERPVAKIVPDPKTIVPANDAQFEFLKRFYTYDRLPLDARVDAIDDSAPDWRKETISFAAAYGGERVPAYFFTPKHASPPYQTLVLFPTSYARSVTSSSRLDLMQFDYLIKSGRAVLYPVYQGTFERRPNVSPGPSGLRDMQVQWAKDFFRSVDYLVTRPDVDKDHLGYYAVSMGAYYAPIPIALEPRIKAAVLIAGGLRYNYADEVQPANFMPRVHVPTLLLNGRDDFGSTLEAQERYLELLGTREKVHHVLDGGHVPGDWRAVIRETLDWYDRYLGPVK